jgi:hypothetical protein
MTKWILGKKAEARWSKIQVDATALAQPGTTSFTIAGVGTFSTATVQTIILLPGWQAVSTSGGLQFNFLAEVADPLTGQFDVVNYDPVAGQHPGRARHQHAVHHLTPLFPWRVGKRKPPGGPP